MATYNAYTKALQLLKDRELYWGDQASYDDKPLEYRNECLARASAYNSAWWIVHYAMTENWDSLDQFDTYQN